MATRIDLSTWSRAEQFRWFRSYARPQYTVTTRLDVTELMAARARGRSAYRATLYAIGAGVAAVPEFRMRFDETGEGAILHDQVGLSMTVPVARGGFAYAYVPFEDDFDRFDAEAARLIDLAGQGTVLNATDGGDSDVVFLSCLPWLDFTAVTNALMGPHDSIPRISWGKIVSRGAGYEMAMGVEVHHAFVDGEHLAAFFAVVQERLAGVT